MKSFKEFIRESANNIHYIENLAATNDSQISISEGKYIIVHKIIVPKEKRGEGVGEKILKTVLEYADTIGKTVVLDASGDFGGSVNKLKKWYKRHGFVENKGRKQDYEISYGMYRLPK